MKNNYSLETIMVHGDYNPFEHNRSRMVPIYQTSAFCYDNTDYAAELFALNQPGFIYMRLNNPTVDEAEKRIALLEDGIGAVAFSSGMAAISGLIFNMLKSGDEIIAANCLYGASIGFMKDTLSNVGIQVKFFDSMKPEGLEKLITAKTRLILIENLANPLLVVPDFEQIVRIAKKARIPLAVDNTIATPYLSNPINYGADFVVHSCTKYMEGHGSIIGGMVVDAGTFQWDQERFPLLFEAAPGGKSFVEKYGNLAFLVRLRDKILMNLGGCMPPFHAFLLIHGLESLHVRMERHCQNAMQLAQYLEKHPKVAWVCYPGLESHPAHANAKKYLKNGFGAMIGFGLQGGYESCKRFIDNIKLLSHSTNIGDTKTLIIHPASTTHRELTEEDKKAAGITDDFIRMSVGIENVKDLIGEIENVLSYIG